MIRLTLAIGGLPFEDFRFKGDDWESLKPKTPYGEAPVIDIDGKMYSQSDSILRYCGKLSGIYPSDPLEALFVDEIIDTLNDAANGFFTYRGDDKEMLKASREKAAKETLPKFMLALQKRVEEFGDGPFLTGEKVTTADVKLMTTMLILDSGYLDFVPKGLLEGYPRLMRAINGVKELPAVVEWYKNRAN